MPTTRFSLRWRSSFLRLPRELRDMIYEQVFQDGLRKNLQILRISKQIYNEAISIALRYVMFSPKGLVETSQETAYALSRRYEKISSMSTHYRSHITNVHFESLDAAAAALPHLLELEIRPSCIKIAQRGQTRCEFQVRQRDLHAIYPEWQAQALPFCLDVLGALAVGDRVERVRYDDILPATVINYVWDIGRMRKHGSLFSENFVWRIWRVVVEKPVRVVDGKRIVLRVEHVRAGVCMSASEKSAFAEV